jgi:hypothetical protein
LIRGLPCPLRDRHGMVLSGTAEVFSAFSLMCTISTVSARAAPQTGRGVHTTDARGHQAI